MVGTCAGAQEARHIDSRLQRKPRASPGRYRRTRDTVGRVQRIYAMRYPLYRTQRGAIQLTSSYEQRSGASGATAGRVSRRKKWCRR
jgi:hypothetical protein